MRSTETETRGRPVPIVRGLRFLVALAVVAVAWACGSDPCKAPECTAGSSGTAGTGSGSTPARSGPCASDAGCDVAHGFSCTAGECRHACTTHFDCEGQGVCQPLTDTNGQALGNYCALFDAPEPTGQYYTHCPNYTECDAASGFTCLGAGVGDTDAYCSAACGVDTDCPTGFFCDTIQDSSGNTGPFCVRRQFCAPCTTDADCLTIPGQICAHDPSGEMTCTQVCDPNSDSCPWGNATVCGMFDPARAEPICAHRFQSCHGTGKSCEPCVRDSDCPRGICYGSSYTGERWCIDDSVTCDCTGLTTTQHICENGNGCPRTPGGLEMSCYDFSRGAGDPLAHACFQANTTGSSDLASPQAGCWGPH
jgi:hypothetical protein